MGKATISPNDPPKIRITAILQALTTAYPGATCALHYKNPYQLLVATILSAQCTDVRVNMVTPKFFTRYPNAAALAKASQIEVEELIRSTGFFHNKAKSLLACAKVLVEKHDGEVPNSMEEMVKLPGVGRKTANVILGNAFRIESGIVVDTHVRRLSERLGLTKQTDPEKIEQDLMKLVPGGHWVEFGHQLILHGRQICQARKPKCKECTLQKLCPSAVL
jgi:endonuclease-3